VEVVLQLVGIPWACAESEYQKTQWHLWAYSSRFGKENRPPYWVVPAPRAARVCWPTRQLVTL